jgi:hypothetical protein
VRNQRTQGTIGALSTEGSIMHNRKLRVQRVLCLVVLSFATAISSQGQQSTTEIASSNAPTSESFRATIRESELPQRPQVLDKKFVFASALVMGLTISDLERTQHCLHRGTCIEMNPMLPHSRAGMYAVNIPINAATMWLGYRMKAQGRRTWWIAPALVAAGHGIGTAFRF